MESRHPAASASGLSGSIGGSSRRFFPSYSRIWGSTCRIREASSASGNGVGRLRCSAAGCPIPSATGKCTSPQCVFSLLSGFSGMATGFASLFAIRLLMGVMEGSYVPQLRGDGRASYPGRRGFLQGLQHAGLRCSGWLLGPSSPPSCCRSCPHGVGCSGSSPFPVRRRRLLPRPA